MKLLARNKLFYLQVAALIFVLGCSISYKFNSASAPTQAKTIAIPNFIDESTGGPPNMSQLLTEQTREYFQRNTPLSIVKANGDLTLECTIVGFTVTPEAPVTQPGGLQIAALNRLTISVKAEYENPFNEKDNFSQVFSDFQTFPTTESLTSVQTELIDQIGERVILQIFTKSFDNW